MQIHFAWRNHISFVIRLHQPNDTAIIHSGLVLEVSLTLEAEQAPVQERLVHGVLVSSRFIRNKCYEIPLKKNRVNVFQIKGI